MSIFKLNFIPEDNCWIEKQYTACTVEMRWNNKEENEEKEKDTNGDKEPESKKNKKTENPKIKIEIIEEE